MDLAVTLKRAVSMGCWEQTPSEWIQERMDEGGCEAARDSAFEFYKREHRETSCSRRETRVERGVSIFKT